MKTVFMDWGVNSGNIKARIVLILFRTANLFKWWPKPWVYIAYPYLIFYRVVVEWILGIELPWKLSVGPRLRLFHGQCLVVNDRVTIGQECIIRHCTTIGVAHTSSSYEGPAPKIGDFVDIGANVVILGDIAVGNRSQIAAGSIVVADIPDDAIVAGNPARVLRIKKTLDQ